MSMYYTPELSEFHLGFEYEYLHDGEWLTVEVTPDSRLRMFEDMIRDGKIRVKGLDREGIESCGWEYKCKGSWGDDYGWPELIDGQERELSALRDGWVTIDNNEQYEDNIQYFSGTLRNKSELKMIMKMLGIK